MHTLQRVVFLTDLVQLVLCLLLLILRLRGFFFGKLQLLFEVLSLLSRSWKLDSLLIVLFVSLIQRVLKLVHFQLKLLLQILRIFLIIHVFDCWDLDVLLCWFWLDKLGFLRLFDWSRSFHYLRNRFIFLLLMLLCYNLVEFGFFVPFFPINFDLSQSPLALVNSFL